MSKRFDYTFDALEIPNDVFFRFIWKAISENLQDNPNGVCMVCFDQSALFAVANHHLDAAEIIKETLYSEFDQLMARDDICLALDSQNYLIIANRHNPISSNTLALKLIRALPDHPEIPSTIFEGTIRLGLVCEIHENRIVIEKGDNILKSAPTGEHTSTYQGSDFELIGKASFDFLPILNVRREFVTFFKCIPRWYLEDGTILDEEDLSQRFRAHSMEHALDAQTLSHAVDQLVDAIDHDAMAKILVPIHYDTIVEEEGFQQFVYVINGLLGVWLDRISFEIKCIPPDLPFEDLKSATLKLAPYSNGLFIQVPSNHCAFGDFGSTINVSYGFDLRHDTRDEAALLAELESFISKIRAHPNLQAHVFGIPSISLSVGAICAGFDSIECVPIDQDLEGWGIDDFMFRPVDLYKQLLKK